MDKTTRREITSLKEDVKYLKDDLKDFRKEVYDFRNEVYDFKLEVNGRIDGLEIRMEQGFKDTLKWMIGLMVGFSSLIIAMIKLI